MKLAVSVVTVLLFTVFALVPCDLLAFEQNKIIGENDLVVVEADVSNIPYKYKDLLSAFGLLNDETCTATHIGNGYVLTAGHCFWAGPVVSKNLPCIGTTISWGVRKNLSPYLISVCERIVFAQHNITNDFAILKVSPIPETAINLELQRKAQAHDEITIFSHPDGQSLHWSKTCVIEPMTIFPSETMPYRCDTSLGSSGAAIIDTTTNKVVGIHNGGALTEPGVGMNYGTFLINPEITSALRELDIK